MTSQVQLGRRIFLVLATAIVLIQLVTIGINLSDGFANLNWTRGVLFPISIAGSVAFMWEGEKWLVGFAAVCCIFIGATKIFFCAYLLISLALITPPNASEIFLLVAVPSLLFTGFPGTLHLIAGLMFLLSQSVSAFFAYQREQRRPLALD